MVRIVRRPRARADLVRIWNYIAELGSDEQADAVIVDIERTVQLLAEHPYMGRGREELLPGLRSFPAKTYLLFYVPLEDGIRLVRVLESRRDIPAIFADEEA